VKTLLATIHIAFVGCHGNPVYLVVTWIPICVRDTWSPVFPTCGRFPWEAPTPPRRQRQPVSIDPLQYSPRHFVKRLHVQNSSSSCRNRPLCD
jgi:hypothetical protein